eukprot:TRINITY_DN1229_c0_g2_i3.p1 TRINITY_DN1229_c0_g2~~TRINITY_DN1229_c0_g2_i3.p1  ORF type:complete len:136 (+),score=16.28 TRINITY_DN1229_c0_g2_i3:115-522(+)
MGTSFKFDKDPPNELMSKTVPKEQTSSKKEETSFQLDEVNAEHHAFNLAQVKYLRTYGAAITGVICGLLGLASLYGFAFYLVSFAFVSIVLLMKSHFRPGDFFIESSAVTTGGLTADVMLFLMSWVITYNVVHVL